MLLPQQRKRKGTSRGATLQRDDSSGSVIILRSAESHAHHDLVASVVFNNHKRACDECQGLLLQPRLYSGAHIRSQNTSFVAILKRDS